MPLLNIRGTPRSIGTGIISAANDLWSPAGFAFTSPAFAFPVVYALAYGVGAAIYGDAMGDRALLFASATITGLLAYLAGVGFAWRPIRSGEAYARPDFDRLLLLAAAALVIIGIAATIAYLVAIGSLPLLMPSVEEARVSAAERGGAALRVTALLALPGVWLLASRAGAARHVGQIAVVISLAALVGGLQLLTANRANAFILVQVAVIAGLLGAGLDRLRIAALALLAALVVTLVLAAGAIGAYRLNATPATWRDPEIAHGVASGNGAQLVAKAIGNYLVVPLQNFSSTMDAVPSRIPWRLGYTFLQPIATILPGKQTTFDQDLKVALQQDYAGGGTVPSMLGEAYANFGPLGWILIPFAIGAFLTFLYRLSAERRTLATRTLYAYALVHMANATIGGIIVASIFPYVAYALLGLATIGESMYRMGQPGHRGPRLPVTPAYPGPKEGNPQE